MSNNFDDARAAISHTASINDAPVASLRLLANRTYVIPLTVALWLLFCLPAILYAEWFPFDLGGIFRIGKQFHAKFHWIISPYNGSGRYFPFYWIFNSIQFQLFGTNVTPYYVVQSLIFVLATLLTCLTLYRVSPNRRYIAILLPLLYFSSPVAENLNTLGKAEPIAYLFMISVISMFSAGHVRANRLTNSKMVFVVVLFLLSLWTKETSIALLGFAATGLALSLVVRRIKKGVLSVDVSKDYLRLFLSLIAGLICAKLPYLLFSQTKANASYIDYQITFKLIIGNFLFYVEQQPDVFIFGLFSIGTLVFVARNFLNKSANISEATIRGHLLIVSLCAMAWAYYLALLIWRWPMGYYMLIPAIIFKLCAVYGFSLLYATIRKKPAIFSIFSCVMTASVIYATCYLYYVTTSQIAFSRIYTEALVTYLKLPATGRGLIMESYPFYSEQVGGTEWLLDIATNSNVPIRGIADQLDPAVLNPDLLKLLDVTPLALKNNVKNLPEKGDYLLAITGNKLATWFLRGVTPYYSEDSLLKKQDMYRMKLVSEHDLHTPAIYVNTWTKKLAFADTFIGYKLYRVLDNEPKFLWHGRYPDGWISSEASLLINKSYGRPIAIRISTPLFLLPNRVIITKNGNPFKTINLVNTDEMTVSLGENSDIEQNYEFKVEKTVAPKALGINDDTRKLGLMIGFSK